MTLRALTTSLTLSCALFLAACGGGGGHKPSKDEAAVKESARIVITDAKRSCSYLTAPALKTFTHGAGVKGLEKCQKQIAAGHLPPTANITVLKLTGDHANVGYTTEQVVGAMVLVKLNGKWLMDRVTTIPTS